MAEAIKARFLVTKDHVTILATYFETQVTIRWTRNDESVRHVRTLIGNLGEVVSEGLNEVFVQDQAKRLDYEIEELYKDNEEKPDDN